MQPMSQFLKIVEMTNCDRCIIKLILTIFLCDNDIALITIYHIKYCE